MINSIPDIDGRKFITVTAILGFLIGGIAAYLSTEDERECQAMEDEIREGQTFDGTVSCYPPGAVEVDLSEELEDRTDLKCVCQIIQDERTRTLPIVTS